MSQVKRAATAAVNFSEVSSFLVFKMAPPSPSPDPRPTFLCQRIDHLFEESDVVGIVVVSEVEDTRFSVLSDPLQSCVAIGNATRLRLELFILFRHLSCCSPPNQSFLLTVTNPLQ